MLRKKPLPNKIRLTFSSSTEAIDNVTVAQTFWTRLKGLLGESKPLPSDRALLITGANSIHGFWMRITIDVIFLDKKFTVVEVHPNCRPFRYLLYCGRASMALEASQGTIERLNLTPGVLVNWELSSGLKPTQPEN